MVLPKNHVEHHGHSEIVGIAKSISSPAVMNRFASGLPFVVMLSEVFAVLNPLHRSRYHPPMCTFTS